LMSKLFNSETTRITYISKEANKKIEIISYLNPDN